MEVSLNWQLSEYEKQRAPQEVLDGQDLMITSEVLRKEFMCAICLELFTKTMTTKTCLHRFCYECINTAIRAGNKECPTCRRKLVSKRDLRPDPTFDALIAALFPARDRMQSYEEKVLKDDLNKSQKVYSSTVEKLSAEQLKNGTVQKTKSTKSKIHESITTNIIETDIDINKNCENIKSPTVKNTPVEQNKNGAIPKTKRTKSKPKDESVTANNMETEININKKCHIIHSSTVEKPLVEQSKNKPKPKTKRTKSKPKTGCTVTHNMETDNDRKCQNAEDSSTIEKLSVDQHKTGAVPKTKRTKAKTNDHFVVIKKMDTDEVDIIKKVSSTIEKLSIETKNGAIPKSKKHKQINNETIATSNTEIEMNNNRRSSLRSHSNMVVNEESAIGQSTRAGNRFNKKRK